MIGFKQFLNEFNKQVAEVTEYDRAIFFFKGDHKHV